MAQSNLLERSVALGAQLKSISVKGFKCFRDRCDLALGDLTLLCGRNSSGKSSFLQPALLLKQTYFAPIDAGPLLLDGQNVQFANSQEMFWHGAGRGGNAARLEFGFRIGDVTRTHVFSLDAKKRVTLDWVEVGPSETSVMFVPDQTLSSTEVATAQAIEVVDAWYHKNVTFGVRRHRCDVYLLPRKGGGFEFPSTDVRPDLAKILGRWMHVPGLRGNPEREYVTYRPLLTDIPGLFHRYTAGILRAWQEESPTLLAQCAADLRRLELTSAIRVDSLSETKASIQVGRTRQPASSAASDLVNIADVGFGVSQVLPVIVALRNARPGDIVHIEQPELHLHPEAQFQLGQILVEVAVSGVTVIAETHSMTLIRGAQAARTRVAATNAERSPVVAHWFDRNAAGATKVHSSVMTGEGMLPDWPEDLTRAAMDADLRFLEASLARDAGGLS